MFVNLLMNKLLFVGLASLFGYYSVTAYSVIEKNADNHVLQENLKAVAQESLEAKVAGVGVIEVTDKNFQQEVLDSKLPVIVDFTAPWCGYCVILTPIFEELSNDYKGCLKFVSILVDNNPLISDKYVIESLPTVMMYYQGKVVGRFEGLPRGDQKAQYQKEIDLVLDKL